MDLVPGEEHPRPGPISPRLLEYDGRQGLEIRARSVRLDAGWEYLQENQSTLRPLKVDLFTSRLTHQCQRYFSWWPDPFVKATDAFPQAGWE